ncbi:MAG: hypothetical protein LBE86_15585 [Gemmobacter sp.]|nr:hypothetical protein [Gemmobacter sp.]
MTDWSEDFAVSGSERAKLQMAHIKLSHSRAFLLRAEPLQTDELLFDAHWPAFTFRSKASSAASARKKKKTSPTWTPA